MIRRPLWNRGGGVFVEEASWNVPVDRRPAADLADDEEATPAVRTAPAADRPQPRSARPGGRPARGRGPKPAPSRVRNEGLRSRPTWLGILTVREDE